MKKPPHTKAWLQGGSEESLSREILAYLAEHQNAQDTLEGIMEWWLLEQQIKRIQKQVQAALAELVAQKLVIETRRAGGGISYRINRRKSAEINRLLAGKQEDREAEKEESVNRAGRSR